MHGLFYLVSVAVHSIYFFLKLFNFFIITQNVQKLKSSFNFHGHDQFGRLLMFEKNCCNEDCAGAVVSEFPFITLS